jgi:hypothetical protein
MCFYLPFHRTTANVLLSGIYEHKREQLAVKQLCLTEATN